jgi:SWI/SNF-related matrix-associated actin-dependent regulator 1 of chromatin subfamily A
MEMHFKVAIADEAHYLKSLSSQRSVACVPLLKACKHVILLTGTPALSKPKDLFNLLHIVRPDVFTNFRDFGYRYCDPKNSRFN